MCDTEPNDVTSVYHEAATPPAQRAIALTNGVAAMRVDVAALEARLHSIDRNSASKPAGEVARLRADVERQVRRLTSRIQLAEIALADLERAKPT